MKLWLECMTEQYDENFLLCIDTEVFLALKKCYALLKQNEFYTTSVFRNFPSRFLVPFIARGIL